MIDKDTFGNETTFVVIYNLVLNSTRHRNLDTLTQEIDIKNYFSGISLSVLATVYIYTHLKWSIMNKNNSFPCYLVKEWGRVNQ